MCILDIAIILFVFLESLNVCVLYLSPCSKMGNGLGVFNEWEHLKRDENSHLFARYMTNWVAGTKMIFIALLLVILFTGSELTKLYGVIAMIASIALFYVKLYPIIKKLDDADQITPKGYSKGLAYMISGFMAMFILALALYIGL